MESVGREREQGQRGTRVRARGRHQVAVGSGPVDRAAGQGCCCLPLPARAVMGPTDPDGSSAGRVCVVTGASSGIGKAASLALARLGTTVVLVCRDPARGQSALADVAAAASAGSAQLPTLELADLSSLDQVRDLARRLGARPRIDVLVNNAGLTVGHRRLTADGFEWTFAVNHLAPFLLTNLLRTRLDASAPASVVTVASTAHHGASLDLAD